MSLIKKLMVTEKITEVDFTDIDGFKVQLC